MLVFYENVLKKKIKVIIFFLKKRETQSQGSPNKCDHQDSEGYYVFSNVCP